MTLNGVMALTLRYFNELLNFRNKIHAFMSEVNFTVTYL